MSDTREIPVNQRGVPLMIDAALAKEALRSRNCWNCGHRKKINLALCRSCYKQVAPIDARIYLYLPVGKGFEQAFQHALNFLAQQQLDAEETKGILFADAPTKSFVPPDNRV